MADMPRCPHCGAELPGPEEPCYRCLLGASLEAPDQAPLDPGYLDDLPIPGDTRVIADKYRIIERVGRGSFGVVFRARQENLDRDVAVKMLRAGAFADEAERELFTREARAVAQLNHPNIVAIHDWGVDGGQPFFSMEWVDGPSLAQRVREHPLPAMEAVRIMATVARALHAVHERGLLHRDLKPGNILITSTGVPKVTDFGLAKRTHVDAGATLTLAGQVVGSPGYMAPEQAAGTAEGVGPAADVYGLGATLYCLLTGRPPFDAATLTETLRQVAENEPVSPRRLNAAVPLDVETICLKCLEKIPTRRYATALALAEDLERFLEGRPILARPASVFEHLVKWSRRRPAQARLSAALIVAVVAGALATWTLYHRASGQTRSAAMLRLNIANTLREKAVAARGMERSRLLEEAAAECRRIIGNESETPELGTAQNMLAVVLYDQARSASGKERAILLAEAIAAGESALPFRKREDHPQEWGRTQNNLALAFREQAGMAVGAERKRLLGKSIRAFRDVLEIYTRDAHPEDWALAKSNLAIALSDQGNGSQGSDQGRCFEQAAACFYDALTVITREVRPDLWATVQMNLSTTLFYESRGIDGPGRELLKAKAITACKKALEVFTSDAAPQKFAMLQYNLAVMQADRAGKTQATEPVPLLPKAEDAGQGLHALADSLPQPVIPAARELPASTTIRLSDLSAEDRAAVEELFGSDSFQTGKRDLDPKKQGTSPTAKP